VDIISRRVKMCVLCTLGMSYELFEQYQLKRQRCGEDICGLRLRKSFYGTRCRLNPLLRIDKIGIERNRRYYLQKAVMEKKEERASASSI
jgi:hypothetical protein